MAEHTGAALNVDIDGDVVAVHGEIDMSTSQILVDALDQVGGSPTVDLEGVTFLDSSGIQCLLHATREARDRGEDVILRNPSEPVRRLFELTNVGTTFTIEA